MHKIKEKILPLLLIMNHHYTLICTEDINNPSQYKQTFQPKNRFYGFQEIEDNIIEEGGIVASLYTPSTPESKRTFQEMKKSDTEKIKEDNGQIEIEEDNGQIEIEEDNGLIEEDIGPIEEYNGPIEEHNGSVEENSGLTPKKTQRTHNAASRQKPPSLPLSSGLGLNPNPFGMLFSPFLHNTPTIPGILANPSRYIKQCIRKVLIHPCCISLIVFGALMFVLSLYGLLSLYDTCSKCSFAIHNNKCSPSSLRWSHPYGDM